MGRYLVFESGSGPAGCHSCMRHGPDPVLISCVSCGARSSRTWEWGSGQHTEAGKVLLRTAVGQGPERRGRRVRAGPFREIHEKRTRIIRKETGRRRDVKNLAGWGAEQLCADVCSARLEEPVVKSQGLGALTDVSGPR